MKIEELIKKYDKIIIEDYDYESIFDNSDNFNDKFLFILNSSTFDYYEENSENDEFTIRLDYDDSNDLIKFMEKYPPNEWSLYFGSEKGGMVIISKDYSDMEFAKIIEKGE